MTKRLQSQFDIGRAGLTGAAIGLILTACSDPKPRLPNSAMEVPPTPVALDMPIDESPVSTPVLKSPDAPPPSAPTQEQADPVALVKEFRTTEGTQRRGEIVETLWAQDTPGAVEALRQIFFLEPEFDVKVDIIAGISDSKKPETREGRFKLLVTALAPGQAKDIRELAAQMLVEFDDPRAITLLQQYTQDADPDMREAASEALETRRAVEKP